eukprot:scaffold937_cov181-Cylindrotheca_fusiformis.AAC.1
MENLPCVLHRGATSSAIIDKGYDRSSDRVSLVIPLIDPRKPWVKSRVPREIQLHPIPPQGVARLCWITHHMFFCVIVKLDRVVGTRFETKQETGPSIFCPRHGGQRAKEFGQWGQVDASKLADIKREEEVQKEFSQIEIHHLGRESVIEPTAGAVEDQPDIEDLPLRADNLRDGEIVNLARRRERIPERSDVVFH